MAVFDAEPGFRQTRRNIVARVQTLSGMRETLKPFTVQEAPGPRAHKTFFVRLGRGFGRPDSFAQKAATTSAEEATRPGLDWEERVLVRFRWTTTPHRAIESEENAMEQGYAVIKRLMAQNENWPITYRFRDPQMQVFPDTKGGHIVVDINITCRWLLSLREAA